MLAEDCLEKEVGALMEHPEAVLAESDTRLVDLNGKQKGFYKRYKTSGLTNGKKIARAGFFVKNYFGAPIHSAEAPWKRHRDLTPGILIF